MRGLERYIRAGGLEIDGERSITCHLATRLLRVSLTLRRQTQHNILITEHIGVGLPKGEGLGQGLVRRDIYRRTAVQAGIVHHHRQAIGVRTAYNTYIIYYVVSHLAEVAHVNHHSRRTAGRHAGYYGVLNGYLGLLDLHRLGGDDRAGLVVPCGVLILVRTTGSTAAGDKHRAEPVFGLEYIHREVVGIIRISQSIAGGACCRDGLRRLLHPCTAIGGGYFYAYSETAEVVAELIADNHIEAVGIALRDAFAVLFGI